MSKTALEQAFIDAWKKVKPDNKKKPKIKTVPDKEEVKPGAKPKSK